MNCIYSNVSLCGYIQSLSLQSYIKTFFITAVSLFFIFKGRGKNQKSNMVISYNASTNLCLCARITFVVYVIFLKKWDEEQYSCS